jgi:hypothetical protein
MLFYDSVHGDFTAQESTTMDELAQYSYDAYGLKSIKFLLRKHEYLKCALKQWAATSGVGQSTESEFRDFRAIPFG